MHQALRLARMPNPAVERDGSKLRFLVPFALRAPAAPHFYVMPHRCRP